MGCRPGTQIHDSRNLASVSATVLYSRLFHAGMAQMPMAAIRQTYSSEPPKSVVRLQCRKTIQLGRTRWPFQEARCRKDLEVRLWTWRTWVFEMYRGNLTSIIQKLCRTMPSIHDHADTQCGQANQPSSRITSKDVRPVKLTR